MVLIDFIFLRLFNYKWGERLCSPFRLPLYCRFQSTLSVRRATQYLIEFAKEHHKFQSTLSVRRATIVFLLLLHAREAISIHALREESDFARWALSSSWPWFQSTLSVRRATAFWLGNYQMRLYFNPRSPWGERQSADDKYGIEVQFQSTLSVRRATVSIIIDCSIDSNFNPRSPWGERQHFLLWSQFQFLFQSTLSVRRATAYFPDLIEHTTLFQSTLSVRRATLSRC